MAKMALPHLHKQVEKQIVTNEFSLWVNMIVKANSSGKLSGRILSNSVCQLKLKEVSICPALSCFARTLQSRGIETFCLHAKSKAC